MSGPITSAFTLPTGSASEAIAGSPSDVTLLQMGRLIYRLGHFENFLTLALRGWVAEDEKDRPPLAAFSKKPINQKIDLARRHCVAITDSSLRIRFLSSLEIAESAYAVRNDVIHGAWQVDPVAQRQVAINYAKGEGHERQVVDLDKAAADADAALRELLAVLFEKAELDVMPDMVPFFSCRPPWSAEEKPAESL